jgi:hypothetical protein
MLETGHVSAEEALMVIKEAKARGIQHVVATHGMTGPTNLSVAQAKEFAGMGGYIEFVYGAVVEKGSKTTLANYAEWMKAVGPEHCIMSSDLGGARPGYGPAAWPAPCGEGPIERQGLADHHGLADHEELHCAR